MNAARAPLPEIRASGSPAELGLEYGRAVGSLAHELLEMRMRWCCRNATREEVLQRALGFVPFVEAHAPELLDEVEGLAKGADLQFEEALFLQVASELDASADDGCSAIGSADAPGGPLIAQNWDTDPGYLGKEVIVRLEPSGGPRIMMFAPAGVIGYIGFNSDGVGHVNNSVYFPWRTPGLTGYFLTRKLLGFPSLAEGLNWLRNVPIGSAGSYMMGDAAGTVVNLELSGGSFREIRRSLQGHTNHYLRAPLVKEVGLVQPMLMKPDSLDRMGRLEELLDSDEDAVLRTLRDHDGYPTSICRHEGAGGTQTTASILIRLGRRQMLVCVGNPCVGFYQQFAL